MIINWPVKYLDKDPRFNVKYKFIYMCVYKWIARCLIALRYDSHSFISLSYVLNFATPTVYGHYEKFIQWNPSFEAISFAL